MIGTKVKHKTLGPGTISSLDTAAGRITVDFTDPIEGILHYVYEPKYEGFSSQR